MSIYTITVNANAAMPPGSVSRVNFNETDITVFISTDVEPDNILLVLSHELTHVAHYINDKERT